MTKLGEGLIKGMKEALTDDQARIECVTWTTEAERLLDMKHRKRANRKALVHRYWHTFYWRFLHLTKLARPYSKMMCRLRLYRKFPDGRCMWCGVIHEEKADRE